MKQTILAILVISILLLAGCSNDSGNVRVVEKSSENDVVKIGVVAPLSGDTGFLGQGLMNAVKLAEKDIQGTKYNYEFYFEDDKLDPKQTTTAVTKLANINDVDAIITISSGTGNAATPLATQYEIVHFGIASDSNVANGPYNFIHWTPPDEEAKEWVKEAQDRGYEKLSIIYINQQGALAIVDSAKKYLKNTDIDIVHEQIFNAGETDFRTMILKSQEKNPDAYLIMAFSPELELVYKQMKELGVKVPITGIESYELSNQPELFEGEWYSNAAEASLGFRESYVSAYDLEPSLGAPNGYDVVNMIVEGFERAGKGSAKKPSATEAATKISQIRGFEGALGSLDVGEEGIVWSGAVIKEIRNGKPVVMMN